MDEEGGGGDGAQRQKMQDAYEIERARVKMEEGGRSGGIGSIFDFISAAFCVLTCIVGVGIMLASGLCAFSLIQPRYNLSNITTVLLASSVAFVPGFMIAKVSWNELSRIFKGRKK